MYRSPAHRLMAAGAATALCLLAACGDDDDDAADTVAPAAAEVAPETTATPETSAAPATTATPETTAPDTASGPETSVAPATTEAAMATEPAASEQACADWIAADTTVTAMQFGEGDADTALAAIDAAIASADGPMADTITGLKAEVQAQLADPDADTSERMIELYDEALAWAAESCDIETITVHGLDYHFEGIPSELTTGYKIVDFTNDGAEMHELLTIRINDGVTETIEELVELPEEEVFSKITMINATFAPPGVTSTVAWNLADPGRYVTICFIPVGTVGEAPGDGPPHFTQGMVEEFTVR